MAGCGGCPESMSFIAVGDLPKSNSIDTEIADDQFRHGFGVVRLDSQAMRDPHVPRIFLTCFPYAAHG